MLFTDGTVCGIREAVKNFNDSVLHVDTNSEIVERAYVDRNDELIQSKNIFFCGRKE